MTISFDKSELEVREVIPAIPGFSAEFDYLNYPITSKQNVHDAIMGKRPCWIPSMHDTENFAPTCIPDVIARASVFGPETASFNPVTQGGGKDMYGVEWIYVPTAMGSMEREDVPRLMDDVNDWKDTIKFPGVDSWDWEGSAKRSQEFLKEKSNKSICAWIFTGWFERLISFMGFENAAVALLDEDQEDAIKELMMALSDVICDVVEHYVKYFNADYFYIHDDWGSQNAAFFNADICREFFVPAMKKVTDKIHELGAIAELHSCGNHGTTQIENIIAAGWDIWRAQDINPIPELWEKYGDKITLCPNFSVPEGATDDEKRAIARDFVEKYCTTPGKPIMLNWDSYPYLDKVVGTELYIRSREAYNNWK